MRVHFNNYKRTICWQHSLSVSIESKLHLHEDVFSPGARKLFVALIDTLPI